MDTSSNSKSTEQVTIRANKQNVDGKKEINDEEQALIQNSNAKPDITPDDVKKSELVGSISKTGLKVLVLLACQNCFKNILMRYVMADHGGFLLSTAVIMVELLKLSFATTYIVIIQKQSIFSIATFLKEDWKNTCLLAVPATAYSVQMTLEYIALTNIDPAMFSVLVQMKMLTTAFFFRTVLGKRQMKKQIISLVLLTVGVMLCNMRMPDLSSTDAQDADKGNRFLGISATIGIACSSGFASVYTEKVIKSSRKKNTVKGVKMEEYGLAYMQAQLAIVSLFFLGIYSGIKDLPTIIEKVSQGFTIYVIALRKKTYK